MNNENVGYHDHEEFEKMLSEMDDLMEVKQAIREGVPIVHKSINEMARDRGETDASFDLPDLAPSRSQVKTQEEKKTQGKRELSAIFLDMAHLFEELAEGIND